MIDRKWQSSLGFVLTNTPPELTEEIRHRVPAGDYNVLRRISKDFYAVGNINFQFIQNRFLLGARYAKVLNNRFSFSIGNDIAWWVGYLKSSYFDGRGTGFNYYPTVSIGYRLENEIVLTLKGELIIDLFTSLKTGEIEIRRTDDGFTGERITLALEQPFFKRKHMLLAFSAVYARHFWQMWALYNTFDRYIYYPQFTVGFLL